MGLVGLTVTDRSIHINVNYLLQPTYPGACLLPVIETSREVTQVLRQRGDDRPYDLHLGKAIRFRALEGFSVFRALCFRV